MGRVMDFVFFALFSRLGPTFSSLVPVPSWPEWQVLENVVISKKCLRTRKIMAMA